METTRLSDKVLHGLKLAYERMLEKKRREDGSIAYAEGDKIIVIRVRDMDKKKG